MTHTHIYILYICMYIIILCVYIYIDIHIPTHTWVHTGGTSTESLARRGARKKPWNWQSCSVVHGAQHTSTESKSCGFPADLPSSKSKEPSNRHQWTQKPKFPQLVATEKVIEVIVDSGDYRAKGKLSARDRMQPSGSRDWQRQGGICVWRTFTITSRNGFGWKSAIPKIHWFTIIFPYSPMFFPYFPMILPYSNGYHGGIDTDQGRAANSSWCIQRGWQTRWMFVGRWTWTYMWWLYKYVICDIVLRYSRI